MRLHAHNKRIYIKIDICLNLCIYRLRIKMRLCGNARLVIFLAQCDVTTDSPSSN